MVKIVCSCHCTVTISTAFDFNPIHTYVHEESCSSNVKSKEHGSLMCGLNLCGSHMSEDSSIHECPTEKRVRQRQAAMWCYFPVHTLWLGNITATPLHIMHCHRSIDRREWPSQALTASKIQPFSFPEFLWLLSATPVLYYWLCSSASNMIHLHKSSKTYSSLCILH